MFWLNVYRSSSKIDSNAVLVYRRIDRHMQTTYTIWIRRLDDFQIVTLLAVINRKKWIRGNVFTRPWIFRFIVNRLKKNGFLLNFTYNSRSVYAFSIYRLVWRSKRIRVWQTILFRSFCNRRRPMRHNKRLRTNAHPRVGSFWKILLYRLSKDNNVCASQ